MCALASMVGLVLVLAGVGGSWEAFAAVLFALGGLLALTGVLRMAWLALGGADQPIRSYLRKHLDDS